MKFSNPNTIIKVASWFTSSNIYINWSHVRVKRKFLMILGVVFYKVDFLHLDKCQSLIKVDFNISGIKVSYKVIPSLLMDIMKHSQSTESNKFAISLQYLKKVGAEFIFCMQINFKVSASLHYRF